MGQPDAAVFPPDATVAESFNEALRAMVDREFLASERHQHQHRRAVRDGCHPDLVEFERLFIKRMAKLGVPMFAAEFYRSPDRQNDMFALGHSKARAGHSAHQFGLGVDIVHGTKAWGLSERQWQLIGHTGKELAAQKGFKLVWGGDWKSIWDPAHWELKDWRSLMGGYPWKG